MVLVALLTKAIMAGKTKRAALVLTPEQRATLEELAQSRTAPAREVERAKVLVGYADGTSMTGLQRQRGQAPDDLPVHRQGTRGSAQMGLKDAYHRPHDPRL
jgi:hypothetical protein